MQEKLPPYLKVWETCDRAIASVEGVFLIIALAGMILSIFLQVILRNFFSSGVFWLDPLARHFLLVPIYVGASLATRHRHHLHVDAFAKRMGDRSRQKVAIFLSLFVAAVCAVLLNGACRFVASSYDTGDKIEGFFPTWLAQAVMPYAYFMMSVRFVKEACRQFYRLQKGLPADDPVEGGPVFVAAEVGHGEIK